MNLPRLLFCFLCAALSGRAAPAPAPTAITPSKRLEPRVVIPGTALAGQPFELVLDTGSDVALFANSLLERLQIKFSPPPQSNPASPGTITMGVSDPVDLTIGTKKFHLQLPTYSLPYLEALLSWPSVKNNILIFDADRHVIRSVPALPPETADWQKFKLGPDSVLTFLVPQPDGSTGTIMVDTGDFHGFTLSPARWREWQAAHPQAPTSSEGYRGISIGTGTAVEAYAEEISFGPCALTDIMVGPATPFESHNYANYIGTFGLEALARLDFIVDGPGGFVYLRPKPKLDPAHPAPQTVGLGDWTVDPSVVFNLDSELINSSWYYLLTGDFKTAAASFARAVEKFPQDVTLWSFLGWARENSGDPAGATYAYQRARMIVFDASAYLRSNGAFLQTKGDNMRAIVDYETSLAVLPGKKIAAFATKTLDTTGAGDEAELNQLGAAGWELIRWGAIPPTGRIHYVFQRPLAAPADDTLKIFAASYSAGNKSADVTAQTAKLIETEPGVFFANQYWLEAEPLPGARKTLKISYTYNGKTHDFSAVENEPVSRDLLIETALGHALPGPPITWEYAHVAKPGDSATWHIVAATITGRPTDTSTLVLKRPSQPPSRDLRITACYYGLGDHFADVTSLVTDTLAKRDAFFFVGPTAMQTDPYKGMQKFLLMTYFSNGVRQYYTASDGTLLNREILLENASLGTDIYTRLYREILQMRLGKAPPDFILTVATWPDGWAKTLGQFLGGVVDEKVLFASAQTSDFEPVAGQLCEAYYFAGMMRLLQGDNNTARQYFQKSLATGIKDYNEYRFAAAELVRLDEAPPPAH